jgi:hypothetical protein
MFYGKVQLPNSKLMAGDSVLFQYSQIAVVARQLSNRHIARQLSDRHIPAARNAMETTEGLRKI